MREGALFGTMFGLGVGAVLVGVTVSRLVVGQAPEQPAEEPPPAAAEAPPPAVVAPQSPAVVAPPSPAVVERPSPAVVERPPPSVVSPVAEPPAVASPVAEPPAVASSAVPPPVVLPPAEPPAEAIARQRRTVVRKHRRAPVQEETPLATASAPTGEAEPAVPSPVVGHAPVTILRGGAARPSPGSRAPGPRIIQVDPRDDGGR